MKQICINACQLAITKDGKRKIKMFNKDQVVEYADEHPCLVPVAEQVVDFLTAGEAELMATDWSFSEAEAAIEAEYSKKLFREEGTKKSEVVSQILDIRYRAL